VAETVSSSVAQTAAGLAQRPRQAGLGEFNRVNGVINSSQQTRYRAKRLPRASRHGYQNEKAGRWTRTRTSFRRGRLLGEGLNPLEYGLRSGFAHEAEAVLLALQQVL
jgi:hypothetical protein